MEGSPTRFYSAPIQAGAPPLGLGPLMQGMLAKNAGIGFAEEQSSDPYDVIDRMVLAHLMAIDQEASSRLNVRRLGAGKYEIDGRCVSLRWGTCSEQGVAEAVQLVVCEGEVGGDLANCPAQMPLAAYLQQASNVAASLKGRVPGAPAVARIPQEKRLTFGNSSSAASGSVESLDVLQRCASMRKACEEARLRERAAEAYENGVPWQTPVQEPISDKRLPRRSRAASDEVITPTLPPRASREIVNVQQGKSAL